MNFATELRTWTAGSGHGSGGVGDDRGDGSEDNEGLQLEISMLKGSPTDLCRIWREEENRKPEVTRRGVGELH